MSPNVIEKIINRIDFLMVPIKTLKVKGICATITLKTNLGSIAQVSGEIAQTLVSRQILLVADNVIDVSL